MDRLMWFYGNNDRQCLDQAVWIATAQEIDIERIGIWSEREREIEKFEIFPKRLRAGKTTEL